MTTTKTKTPTVTVYWEGRRWSDDMLVSTYTHDPTGWVTDRKVTKVTRCGAHELSDEFALEHCRTRETTLKDVLRALNDDPESDAFTVVLDMLEKATKR